MIDGSHQRLAKPGAFTQRNDAREQDEEFPIVVRARQENRADRPSTPREDHGPGSIAVNRPTHEGTTGAAFSPGEAEDQ